MIIYIGWSNTMEIFMRQRHSQNDSFWIFLIGLSTLFVLTVSVYCLSAGITIVFPHLYYIPILLAVYKYLQKGLVFSVGLAIVYLLLVDFFTPSVIVNAIIRALVFCIIGLVVLIGSNKIIAENTKYSNLFYNSEAGSFIFDPDGNNIITSNKKFSELTGYAENELNGCSLEIIVPDNTKREYLVDECISAKHLTGFNVTFTGKNNRRFDVLLSASVMPDNVIACTVVDITLQNKMVNELQSAHHQLFNILDFLPDATFAIDTDGTVIFWNKAIEKLTGVDKKSIIGMGNFAYSEAFFKNRDPILVDHIINPQETVLLGYTNLSRDGDILTAERYIPTFSNGEGVYLWMIASPLFDDNGDLTGAIESIRDISWQKEMDFELKQALEKTMQSNDDLEQFAYVASHDLQEPLRMVSSYMQLLEKKYKGKLDSEADEFIFFAVDGANRMQLLINDLLDYSRVMTRGRSFEQVDTEEILGDVMKDMQISIRDNGVKITHDPLPVVMADGIQIASVFHNLISNSIKYRSDKPPEIHVDAKKEKDEWVFSVQDNGIGIDQKYRERIFIIFQRLHGRNEYPGTGIGLATSKRIVERHGGRIWVESEPGNGSVFKFTLPIHSETV